MKFISFISLILLPFFNVSFVRNIPPLNYTPAIDFFSLPYTHNFGEVSGVAVNSKGHIFVFNRGPKALMEFDSSGKFIRTLGDGLFKISHGIRIDAEDNIWLTD